MSSVSAHETIPVLQLEPPIRQEPWQAYEDARRRSGFARAATGRSVFATRYDTATDVLTSREFSVQHPFRSTRRALGPTLLDVEGPEHERIRDVLAPVFRRSSVNKLLSGVVREELANVWDAVDSEGAVDWTRAIADLLPMRVLCRLLGLPPADAAHLSGVVRPVVDSIDTGMARQDEALKVRAELTQYLELKLFGGSGDGELGAALLSAESDGRLTQEECIRNIELLLVAGSATVSSSLNALAQTMASRADLWASRDDAIVREMLRLESPVRLTPRFARQSCQRDGLELKAGDLMLVLISCANRDERAFERSDEFDTGRTSHPSPLTFGRGLHSCIGVLLAEAELLGTLGLLRDVLPGRDVIVEPSARYRWTLRSFGDVTLRRM